MTTPGSWRDFGAIPCSRAKTCSTAIRSVFIKGADDVEGVVVLALARKLLAGDRVGDVPPEAGQPPIVDDFRRTAAALKLDLDKVQAREIALDLYRKDRAREISRLFHRLGFLDVPFAQFVAGPDFVAGQNLERMQETWRYHWSPQTESALIERSLYGSTLEEAATARLLERIALDDQRRPGTPGRCRGPAFGRGLPDGPASAYARCCSIATRELVAEDGRFVSLVQCARAPARAARLARAAGGPSPGRRRPTSPPRHTIAPATSSPGSSPPRTMRKPRRSTLSTRCFRPCKRWAIPPSAKTCAGTICARWRKQPAATPRCAGPRAACSSATASSPSPISLRLFAVIW